MRAVLVGSVAASIAVLSGWFSPARADLTCEVLNSCPTTTTTTTAPTTTSTTAAATTTTTTEPATTTSSTTTTPSTTTTSTASTTTTTTTTTTPGLGVSSPADAALGTGTGGSLTAQLGAVTISVAGSLVPQAWTVTVSSSDFVNGSVGTIARSNVAYASGGALPESTMVLTTPGQPTGTPVPLSSEVTAFSGVGQAGVSSVSWNPTIVVTVPPDSPDGEYNGTITHSLY